jgi:hypothetical protein
MRRRRHSLGSTSREQQNSKFTEVCSTPEISRSPSVISSIATSKISEPWNVEAAVLARAVTVLAGLTGFGSLNLGLQWAMGFEQ